MNVIAIMFLILAFISFFSYLVIKYKNKKYIFSIFNCNIYIYAFTLFFVTYFQFDDKAWLALRIGSAQPYFYYLYKCIFINSLEFIIFTCTMIYVEFSVEKNRGTLEKLISRVSSGLSNYLFHILFIPIIIVWVYITLKYNEGTFPIFNRRRDFYIGHFISPIYQGVLEIINVYALYYGIISINKKKIFAYVFYGISICVLFMATSRTKLFVQVLYVLVVFFLYNKIKKPSKTTRKIIKYSLLMLVVALAYKYLRSTHVTDNFFVNEILYGNSFCDIRDGAYMLWGHDNNFGGELLYGKTYLSAILSFIPSKYSAFRREWGISPVTTQKLVYVRNINAFGMRGGHAFEAYINFGIIGIFIEAIFCGYVFGCLEKYFYKNCICENKLFKNEKDSWMIFLLSIFASNIYTTSGFFNVYAILVYLFICIIIFAFLPKKQIKNKKLYDVG